jgi:hypothetical protein
VAGAVYWEYGTISPCGVLRETVRQRDGLAAPAGQYGELSPGRCFAILTNLSTPIPNTAQASRPQATQPAPQLQLTPRLSSQAALVTAQDPLQWAVQMAVQATNECRAKRLNGGLPTHVASAQWSTRQ